MKICHLNTIIRGGATAAARRLHDGLRQTEDIVSTFGTAQGYQTDWSSPAIPIANRGRIANAVISRIERQVERRRYSQGKPYTYHSDCRTKVRPENLACFLPTDIFNLHWIANFIDWETCLPWLAEKAPIVWTLHDMNPFSGIWHYVPDEKEKTTEMIQWDAEVLACKQRAIDRIPAERMIVVGPSRWISQEAQNSTLLGKFQHRVIPYGLDTSAFRQIPQSAAREVLGIAKGRNVIGFLAHGMGDPRKGFAMLRQALEMLPKGERPLILTAGGGSTPDIGFDMLHLGKLSCDSLIRLFYCAIDVFVCPSLQDNLPNTVLESFACGTPVIAFEIGGLPDMVRPGKTGWLVPPFDTSVLSATITNALRNTATLRSLGTNCRAVAEHEYALEKQADAYKALYTELQKL